MNHKIEKSAQEYYNEMRNACFEIRKIPRLIRRGFYRDENCGKIDAINKCYELKHLLIAYNEEHRRLSRDGMKMLENLHIDNDGDFIKFMVNLQILGYYKLIPNQESFNVCKDKLVMPKRYNY